MPKDYFLEPSDIPGSKRLTLTKAQLSSPEGQAIVRKLEEFSGDGFLDLKEAKQLLAWSQVDGRHEFPAMRELRDLLVDILADGKLDKSEESELFRLVKRIVPPDLRREINQVRRESLAEEREDEREERRLVGGLASDAQLNYIRDLGGNPSPNLRKFAASTLIDELVSKRPITNRQRMVLTFWNRLDLASSPRRDVSQWMDDHYNSNPDHKSAWELFKVESGDTGGQDSRVEIQAGIGYQYLNRVGQPISSRVSPSYRQAPQPSNSNALFLIILAITGLVVGFLFCYATNDEFRDNTNRIVLTLPERLGLR